jgi:hypothetical protein
MSAKDRLRKGIFQGENSYCHYSKCKYFNQGSQRLAFVCAEGYTRINLEKYKDCKWELDQHNVRIDGVLISCAWSEFIPSLLKDLDEILAMRRDNEIRRNNLKANAATVPVLVAIPAQEQSKEV